VNRPCSGAVVWTGDGAAVTLGKRRVFGKCSSEEGAEESGWGEKEGRRRGEGGCVSFRVTRETINTVFRAAGEDGLTRGERRRGNRKGMRIGGKGKRGRGKGWQIADNLKIPRPRIPAKGGGRGPSHRGGGRIGGDFRGAPCTTHRRPGFFLGEKFLS